MTDISFNNKRIVKNTFMLYSRTLIIMLVSLYTSRVVLKVLGIEDYGIYNVVGGIVVMFSFITSTLGSASQRYIAYDLAQKNEVRLRQTFSLIMLSYGLVALITLVLAEIIGVWFLNSYMNIPENRMVAANWVLQASIIGFIINIFTAPYMAVIIAHERMNVYAYLSVLDAVLKLSSVYILQVILFDSLIVYAILMMLCTYFVTSIYRYYCKKYYHESHYSFYYEKMRFLEISFYAWWNMIGALANVLRGQGINILLNLFFNPAINAARAIAYQVNSAVNSLSQNFYSALRPQITKSYSTGDVKRMHSLIFSSTRLSFCLLLIISVPIYIHAEKLLCFWLGSYPHYSVIFIKLVIINSLFEVFSMPLVAGMQATGHIKSLQQIVAGTYLLNLPLSFILLKYGYGPEYTIYVNMLIVAICMIPRLYLCHRYYNLDVITYTFNILLRCLAVAIIAFLVGIFLDILINCEHSQFNFVVSFISSLLLTVIISFLFGINNTERKIALQIFNKII